MYNIYFALHTFIVTMWQNCHRNSFTDWQIEAETMNNCKRHKCNEIPHTFHEKFNVVLKSKPKTPLESFLISNFCLKQFYYNIYQHFRQPHSFCDYNSKNYIKIKNWKYRISVSHFHVFVCILYNDYMNIQVFFLTKFIRKIALHHHPYLYAFDYT